MAGIPIRGVIRIDSDWASVILVSSKVLIERDPGFIYPPDVRFTGTQLFVGEQSSLRYEKRSLPFIIVGEAATVDVITAHGDSSGSSEPGNVVVNIGPVELVNNEITGDGVNAKVFPRVPLVPE